jgi:hypothetical protein
MKRWMWSWTLTILMGTVQAKADLPPPDGYVETCTVTQQQGMGEECVTCQATYAQACNVAGYVQRCRSWGASVWTEVWCRASTGAAGGTSGGPSPAGGALVTTGGVSATEGGSASATGGAGTDDVSGGGCALSVGVAVTSGSVPLFGMALIAWLLRRRSGRR